MYTVKTLNKIAAVGLQRLPTDCYTVGDTVADEHAVLVRSANMHDYPMGENLWAIARAGAGTNNIPVAACAEKGVVVFNTPGANANAVKELTLCALMLASRDIVGGCAWVRQQAAVGEVAAVVEKGKAAFVGPELAHKSLGVVGLGAIGVLVANAAIKLDMEVYGYDPYLSVDTALRLDRHVHVVKDIAELYRTVDYITLHLPYMESTRRTINADAIAHMKQGVRVINLARGELVDDAAMAVALADGKVARYVTDFPNNAILAAPNVVATPHLGASTPESEDNCAVMAAVQLRDFLENGNIKNAVNFPNVEMERSGVQRLCIIHRNIPAMLAGITAQLSQDGVNVENMTNKSRGEYAYTLVDVGQTVDGAVIRDIQNLAGIIRVRVI